MSGPAPFDQRLIVVLAAGRSGSTWLNQLLLAHPRIAGVEEGETAIFHGLLDTTGSTPTDAGAQA